MLNDASSACVKSALKGLQYQRSLKCTQISWRNKQKMAPQISVDLNYEVKEKTETSNTLTYELSLFLTNLCSPTVHMRHHLIFQVSACTMSSWLQPGLVQPNLCDSTWAGQNASYHFRLAQFPTPRVTLHDNYTPHYTSQEINVCHQPRTTYCHLSRSLNSVTKIQTSIEDFWIWLF